MYLKSLVNINILNYYNGREQVVSLVSMDLYHLAGVGGGDKARKVTSFIHIFRQDTTYQEMSSLGTSGRVDTQD